MISENCENFLKGIEDDIPAVKLIKYRHYLYKKPKEAQEIKQMMLDLSLKNSLIGEYEMIHRTINVSVEQNPEYRKLRDAMTSEANRMITEASTLENVVTSAHNLAKLGNVGPIVPKDRTGLL